MTANTPPKPHTEGMVWTNEETGIKYQFAGGAWRAVSSAASEEVAETIDNLDLQKVLDAGNVADKGATFGGKVIVEPGTEGSEVVTYQQLAELDLEIEDIRPSIDRGEWTYTPGDENLTTGQYIAYKRKVDGTYCNELYAACLLTAGDDVDAKAECNKEYIECGIAADSDEPDLNANWEYCDFIKLHRTDVNGRLHTFSDAEGGMYVEIFNTNGSGFGLYQIIPNGVASSGGQVIGLYVTHVHSEGSPNGNARVKLFELASANPADYVKKAGDTMTGELKVINETETIFQVKGNGQVQAGDGAATAFMATEDHDVVTKKYADLLANGPAKLAWRWLGNKSSSATPDDGGFYNNGGYLRFSFKTDNNVDLGLNPFPDTSFLTASYGPIGTIWHYDKSVNKWQLMRQLRIDGFRWNYKDHIEYKLSSSHGRSFDELIIEQPYYITIGGWF